MHSFLSNLAIRQTDKRTPANGFTSFVGDNKCIGVYVCACGCHVRRRHSGFGTLAVDRWVVTFGRPAAHPSTASVPTYLI